MDRKVCRQCGRKIMPTRERCARCEARHVQAVAAGRIKAAETQRHEPTEAELDVMIAEQRANLPEWWANE